MSRKSAKIIKIEQETKCIEDEQIDISCKPKRKKRCRRKARPFTFNSGGCRR